MEGDEVRLDCQKKMMETKQINGCLSCIWCVAGPKEMSFISITEPGFPDLPDEWIADGTCELAGCEIYMNEGRIE